MRLWVHRVTVKTIVDIQKDSRAGGIADSIYELIAAFRLYEAIECWLAGDQHQAMEHFSKVRTDKFTDTDMLLRVQGRIKTMYRQEDPFTDTCVAAHQQLHDWAKLVNGATEEQLAKIKARHEMYRLCQAELTPRAET